MAEKKLSTRKKVRFAGGCLGLLLLAILASEGCLRLAGYPTGIVRTFSKLWNRDAESLAPEALKLLAKARVAEGNKAAGTILGEAGKKQRSMIEEFEQLLKRLDRWNEFQDVITNTRSILDKQREIKTRTETLQGGKRK